ncbi:MAG: heme-binding protein [Hyphomicrobiales bacterium]|nr:heme-binding protein [Hyphomicrobiales bacterium]MDE2115591.1 heme-binding protein [Hyphomicrobiales bacterium]
MNSIPAITEAMARAAVDAMRNAAFSAGQAATFVVSDSHGEAIIMLRMDDAGLPTPTIATNKAFTAARLARPSRAVGARLKESGDIAFYGDARYVGFAGGLPVTQLNKTLGAIGVSGLTEDEDEALARVGVAIIAALLRA